MAVFIQSLQTIYQHARLIQYEANAYKLVFHIEIIM